MCRTEVEIPQGTQIAVLELLEKGNVLSCPCDVDESVVTEYMNQSGSLGDMQLCGQVVTGDSDLDLTGEDKQLLESFLQEYQHIYSVCVTPLVQQRIYTGDDKPISMKLYCVPLHQQMLGTRHGRRTASTIDNLGQCKIFSVVALTGGYHQIGVHPDDQGVYKYVSLPYCLINGPATFQKLMDSVLRDLTSTQCMVYIDDLIIFSKDMKQHVEHLRSKCHFAVNEVRFLGHVIDSSGVSPDLKLVETVQLYQSPTNVKELQSFLGSCNYYCSFINNYAIIARPLTILLKKGIKLVWTYKFEQSFIALKKALTTSPVLAYSDFSVPFLLATDASQFAIGSVLSQVVNGEEHLLNKAETNYSVTEKVLLAVVWSIKHFCCYLVGNEFTIWMLGLKDPSGRLICWSLQLSEYVYRIQYCPGRKHGNADCMSR
ncbi:hypothetical protein PR048_012234 [Dryococelus australis]|uniref:Retrovirus-related Pol polyprotein from transposon 17.6 n=1 Tax=Dryococelus australis TaxID=614101 RepID=A0ABQ9HQ24_9NEOP|nr:hypothetical protein PR048_012234 [Dryococelus australis]